MKRKWMVVIVVLLAIGPWMGLGPLPVQAAHVFSGGGNGSSIDPYIIRTAEDLDHVRDELTASYKLQSDIDLTSYDNWNPIGTSANAFEGQLDGAGYTISGMTIVSSADYIGLFGYVLEPATIHNVRLENVNITSSNTNSHYVGGLVGLANSSSVSNYYMLDRISITGEIHGNGFSTGGIVGLSTYIALGNSDAHVSIYSNGYTYIGGLVGYNNNSIIEQSYATGDVSSSRNAGGLVGYSGGSSNVRNSYATGHVTGVSNAAIGGLIGAGNSGTVENSYATGTVTRDNGLAGGLVGDNNIIIGSGMSIANSYWNLSDNPGLNTTGNQSGTDGAMSLDAMKEWVTYIGWDSAIWGIHEDMSPPYLKSFSPVLRVDPLSSAAYSTEPEDNHFMISGYVRDGSIGEPLEVSYTIKDASNGTVTQDVYAINATSSNQTFNFPVMLEESSYTPGTYTINITASDSVPAHEQLQSLTFEVEDKSPPAAPIITIPSHGHMTNNTKPTISGTSEARATVTVVMDGNIAGTTTAGSNGSWVWTAVSPLPEGMHVVKTRASDEVGNVSPDSAVHTFTIDVKPPIITLIGSPSMQVKVGSAYTDPGATAQDAVDGDLTSQIKVTGAVNVSRAGSYVLTYKVQDSSGNAAASVLRTVDVVSSGAGAGGESGGGSGSGSSSVEQSSNANLAQLTLRVGGSTEELTPQFAPEITEYTMETSGEQLVLQWVAADSKAVVKLRSELVIDTTSIPLVVGTQVVKITVQAENGTRKVYTITVTRLDDNENASSSLECAFTDIQAHWAKTDICEAARLQIVEGVNTNIFAPDKTVTRAELAVMLMRTLQIPGVQQSAANPFSDKDSTPEWARLAIHTGAVEGIFNGYPDGTFRPQQEIDRAEMAAMLAKALKWETDPELDLTFSDRANIPAWAQSYVQAAYENGLLQGRGDNQFVSDGMTTRAEAAVVMLRLWKSLY